MDVAAMLAPRIYAALFVVEVLVITAVARKVDDWRTRAFDDEELIASGNVALGLRRAGLFLGGIVAMASVASGPSNGVGADLLASAIFGVSAYAALFLARAVCRRAILPGVDDDAECARGNVAVGLVEFGIFAATGILLNGALAGDAGSLGRGLVAFGLFFVLGQAVFVVLALAFARMTPFDDRQEILRGNRALGVEFVGLFVAIALVLRAGLLGGSQDAVSGVLDFLVGAVVGALLLLLFQLVVRRIFLGRAITTRALSDDNLASALALQGLTVGFGLLLAGAVV